MEPTPTALKPTARHFAQEDRGEFLVDNDQADCFRKSARILAIQMLEPFTVETDRGVMAGVAGDWLVTNHPDDDPGSDLWTISEDRMRATYERTSRS